MNSADEPNVRQVMSQDIIYVSPDRPAKEAAKMLKDSDRGSLVVGGNGKMEGIVTNSDIVEKYVLRDGYEDVKDIMSTDLVTISPRKSIEEAALIMVKKSVERLPVMEGDKLIGMISANDIIKVQPSLYLELTEGLKLGEDRFGRDGAETDVGQCDSCENYSENLKEVNGEMLCEDCREERLA